MNREYWFVTHNSAKLGPDYIRKLSDIVNRIPSLALPSTSTYDGHYLDVTRTERPLKARLRGGRTVILEMERRSVNVPPGYGK